MNQKNVATSLNQQIGKLNPQKGEPGKQSYNKIRVAVTPMMVVTVLITVIESARFTALPNFSHNWEKFPYIGSPGLVIKNSIYNSS